MENHKNYIIKKMIFGAPPFNKYHGTHKRLKDLKKIKNLKFNDIGMVNDGGYIKVYAYNETKWELLNPMPKRSLKLNYLGSFKSDKKASKELPILNSNDYNIIHHSDKVKFVYEIDGKYYAIEVKGILDIINKNNF